MNKQFLAPPPAPTHKAIRPPPRNELDDFLSSSEADLDLELSFASTVSLHSPPRDSRDFSEDTNYVPMDISPAPQRVLPSGTKASGKPTIGRPRALASSTRLFGKDVSNDSAASLHFVAKSSGTGSLGKRLQRSTLPLEWMSSGQNDHGLTQPQNIPSSPAASDAMDIDFEEGDSSFVYIQSSSVPGADGPLSAAQTVRAFKYDDHNPLMCPPASAAPTVTTFNRDYFSIQSSDAPEGFEKLPDESELTDHDESPVQPFPRKRRSFSPGLTARRDHQRILKEAAALDSSPAASPMMRKAERIAQGPPLKKPMLAGLGAPLEFNPNKKKPRRPALSAIVHPGESPIMQPRSAYPSTNASSYEDQQGHEPVPERIRQVMPPVRRAFSAMLPPSLLEQSMSSEDGSTFDNEGPETSSPAQAYAKRQHVKTIRRCDGTDDFRPVTGATAMVRRDSEVVKKILKRSEDRVDGVLGERDTPRSKYLNAGPNFGGFGDNETFGKILPCHRVREDGLMRITSKTLDNLLDGVYDAQLASFHILDCRFDYEYNGGHVPGAVNINTTAGVEEYLLGANAFKPVPSVSGDANRKTVLVFHCEFSVKRAPTFAKHLRSKDRALNNHVYPNIHYPEVYILEGGYSQYFQDSSARCQPCGYVRMDDPHYAASRKEDLDQFRKGKFGRTKSYAFGEGKMVSGLSQQPKRNSAPNGGTTALFAAANAARTRRGGLGGSGLHMLAEDSPVRHHSDDEDTDIGDSPCPPPSKGVPFKGKKIGRLAKAETYDGARMLGGF